MSKPYACTGIKNAGILTETDVLRPAALAAGETVQLALASFPRILEIDAAGVWFLDSIEAPPLIGTVMTVVNVSPYAGALGHAEGAAYGGAADDDCLLCPDAIPYVLRPGARVDLRYGPYNDTQINRWNVIGVNRLAPDGFLCPATPQIFQERTAFLPTFLWACDDRGLGSAQPLHGSGNNDLAVQNAPLLDWRMAGAAADGSQEYRGVQVTEAANGWRAALAGPGLNSIWRGVFFGQTAPDAADNNLFGRINLATGLQNQLRVSPAGNLQFAVFDGAAGLAVATPVKVVNDGVVRFGCGNLNRVAQIANARVATRGEAPVASPDVAAVIATLSGGAAPFDFVGGTAASGAVATTFIGGAIMILGAQAETARINAKISHRLGAE